MNAAPLSPTLRASAADFAGRFGGIVEDMRTTITEHLLRHAFVVLIVALWSRLGRSILRFERLMARIAAGKLPPPRGPRHASPEEPPRATPRAVPLYPPRRFPTAHGWLARAVGSHLSACGAQLQDLLAQPGMDELLATCPAAGRILRPLCHMLGLPAPGPPPPPRAPRIRAPRVRATPPRPSFMPEPPPPGVNPLDWHFRHKTKPPDWL